MPRFVFPLSFFLILVGDTRLTRDMGIDTSKFAREEFMIKTFPGRLVIIGDDERPDGVKLMGTLLAADTFALFLRAYALSPGAPWTGEANLPSAGWRTATGK